MKQNLCSVIVIGTLTIGGYATLGQGNSGAVVPDNFIVELRAGAAPAAVVARHGLSPNFIYDRVINGFAGFVPPGILKKLQADPDVAVIVPDREVTAIAPGKKPPGGGGARQPQVIPAGVERIGAPALFDSIDASTVGVAVVDTGLDFSHPDLTVSPSSFTAYRPNAKDGHGHGTHVGGIIAAKNDDYDVVGVAPGATLYAVKVLNNSGSGYDSTVIAGLNWIAQNYSTVTPNIRVVNMSLGRGGVIGDNLPYQNAIRNLVDAGITVVVAAGNACGTTVDNRVPACYPEVIAVASTTALDGASTYPGFAGIPADTASFFTTDGVQVVVSAPGEDKEDVSSDGVITSVGILSTRLGGGTTRMSGTSMASPHVAGVAALIYAAGGDNSDEVRVNIAATASRFLEVPLDSPTSCYTFDGIREGVVSATAASP